MMTIATKTGGALSPSSPALSSTYHRLPADRRHAIACASFGMAESERGRIAASNALAEGPCRPAALFAAIVADDLDRQLKEKMEAEAAHEVARQEAVAGLAGVQRQVAEMRFMLGDTITHAQRVDFIRENLVVSGPDGLRTDSLAVAELYGREHKNVLRVVRELLEDVPDYRLNFEPSSRSWVSGNGTERSGAVYTMNREGFGLLSAAFTGREARRWTAAYISALEQRNTELRESERREEIEACFGPHMRRLGRVAYDIGGKGVR